MTINTRAMFSPNNFMLAGLVFLIFIIPILPAAIHSAAYNIMFSFTLIASSLSLNSERRKIIFATAVILIIFDWVAIPLDLLSFTALSRMMLVVFFIFIVFGLIRQTAATKEVTKRSIVDSISGYLLLGVVFAIAVLVLYRINPTGFSFNNESERMSDIFYYTFITYTTTGYGDILPVTTDAKSLVILMATSGQLYVAIIIALLVGKFASRK